MKHILITIAAVLLVGAKTVGSELVLSKVKYEQEEKIEISFSGGPNNAEDWVGIYKEEQTPGDVDSTDWLYVNGTQEATTGKSSGQLVFDLAVGKHEAFFVRTVVIKS